MRLLQGAASFAVITVWTGCHQIIPFVFTPQPPGNDVVDCQIGYTCSAVLAGVVISAQDLALGQPHPRAGAFYHSGQANDRGVGE